MRAPAPPARRRAAIHAACRAAALPLYAADLRTIRGRCLARRCHSRWGVVRVSLDFTADRVDRIAFVECATCGRSWRRCKVPPLRSDAGYQAVRLELILPSEQRRWFRRGRWHVEGEAAVVVRDATLGELDEAARAHGARADAHADSLARARAKREAEDAEAIARSRAALEAAAIRRAEREADEAAAAAREAA